MLICYCLWQMWALHRNTTYMLECGIQTVLITVPICNVYNSIWTLFICHVLVYKQHFYAMPIFVVNNNISAFFVHQIETSLLHLAIFDIFQSHFTQLSKSIINTLYRWFCMSHMGITYKFPYKRSLYSEISAVYILVHAVEHYIKFTCETSIYHHRSTHT